MRNVGLTVLLLGLVVSCSHAHSRAADLAPICPTANRAVLDELKRAMHDSARIADLERVSADTATTAALLRALADTTRAADLRRLAADSTWGVQHDPQVEALLADLARFDRCTR